MFLSGHKPDRGSCAALAASALVGLLMVTGCGSAGPPSWSNALGSGVTIVAPQTVSPGNDSPDAVMAGVVHALTVGPVISFCAYDQPTAQAGCNSTLSQVTKAQAAAQLPTFKNFKLGYVAIDGDKALIGTTGTVCQANQTPKCYTNNDPATLLDSGKSFSKLWSAAIAAPANAYSLSPAIEISGKWYAYTSSS